MNAFRWLTPEVTSKTQLSTVHSAPTAIPREDVKMPHGAPDPRNRKIKSSRLPLALPELLL
jgi:hypothetical protein